MSADTTNQEEFSFTDAKEVAGYDRWKQERAAALEKLARSIGLPLRHRVEVWLRGNIRLTGRLTLREEQLFVRPEKDPRLELVVDNVPFTPGEIESCVRLDDPPPGAPTPPH
ncbi:hypothetical protein LBMAG56_42730 [Verrucomicrobiota bacterium]|nr:hypothetical protein LBMAG56_42730 [Verrucomicrobiota bacterium]